MLKEAKEHCDLLVVALQTDPTIDRPEKNKPVQSYEERLIQIHGVRYVDFVIKYSTESELYDILTCIYPDVRFLGTDYIGKRFTGDDLPIPLRYVDRSHGYSTSDLRKRVVSAEFEKIVSNLPRVSPYVQTSRIIVRE
jgi:glycerol-3-phosphate cytidylyltransferase